MFQPARSLLFLALALSTAAAQKPAASDPANKLPQGPVQLQPQPEALKGHVEAFPHLVPGPAVSAAVADRINAALVRADARARASALECLASLKQSGMKPDPDSWSRSITVTMRGPRFLSFDVMDGMYCGGAHPDNGEMALVYDLETGSPVNLLKLLPPGVKGSLGTAADGSKVGLITWPAMFERAKREADADCKDAFTDAGSTPFAVTLDAVNGAVGLSEVDFPHVVQACANGVSVDLATLKRLGASKDLTEALEAAHNQQPKKSAPANN